MSFADMDKVKDPQPGDWWHDHFCPALLVVAVDGDRVGVTTRYETSEIDPSGWRWHDHPTVEQWLTRDRLVQRLSYQGDKALGLWARCVRPESEVQRCDP